MMSFDCLCGGVSVEVSARPEFLHECNCRLCTATGARWGYFEPTAVRVSGVTQGYVRGDKPGAGAEVHFCPACGTTTHFVLTAETIAKVGNSVVGVNLRPAGEAALAGIELRYPDGRGWAGDGPFDYVRPPRVLGDDLPS